MSKGRYEHPYPSLEPYFKIAFAGKNMTEYEHALVEEVRMEDTSSGSDLCSITINDPDYHFIGDKRLLKATKCKVIAGWRTKNRVWIDGYVSAVDVDFPETGQPQVVIHVMDQSYLMNRVERKKVYKNMSYREVAGQVAKMYGFTLDADKGGEGAKKQESVSQSHQTDIQFLQSLADEIGYVVYMDGNKLCFKEQEKFLKQKSVHTFWYRRYPFDILSFQPRIIQADQLQELEEYNVDDKDKKKTKAKAKKS